jgi:negative regulator of replication initiation
MTKTIRVSEEYHQWLSSHKRADETMGDTLRRLTHTPPPTEPIITDEQATEMRDAIETVRESDRNRLSRVAESLRETTLDDDT